MAFFCVQCKAEVDPSFKACPKCGEPITDFLRKYLLEPIDGKYQIIQRLGRGGMGEVFKVLHSHLNSIRVIKTMRPNLAEDPGAHERFVREARLATRIQHQNVATLHDFSTLPDGTYYMVWEYIEGKNVAEILRERGPLPPKYAAHLAIEALMGLDVIHRAGIVHRDVSPENIMIARDAHGEEHVKLIDLGIAKSDADVGGGGTKTGMFVGKWKYASPEHLGILQEGEKIDGRADLYSFGIVLYEMLAGRPPYIAQTPGQYMILHSGETPRPPSIETLHLHGAPQLEEIIFRALEKDRNKRFASAREFAQALDAILPTLPDSIDMPQFASAGKWQPSFSQATTVERPETTQRDTIPPDKTYAVPAPTERNAPLPSKTAWAPNPQETPARPSPYPQSPQQPAPRRGLVIGIGLVLAFIFLGGMGVIAYFAKKYYDESKVTTAAIAETKPVAPVIPSATSIEAPAPPIATDTTTTTTTATATTTTTETTATTTSTETATPTPPTQTTPPPPTETVSPRPGKRTPPPVEPSEPEEPEPPPPPPPEPAPSGDSIGGSGFGRRSRAMEMGGDFRRGIIRDYSDMYSGAGVDWAAIRPGVKLSDYKIKVGKFRDLTGNAPPEVYKHLNYTLQEEMDGIAGGAGNLTTQSAIYFAAKGIGIEMVFRDSSGRVVAKLRHLIRGKPGDAAEEMVEAVTDFVEDHPVR